MKKYLLPSIMLTSLLFSGIAFAEVSSSTKNKINETRQKIEDIKQKAQEDINKIKSELKNAIEIKIGKKLDEQKIKIADQFEKTMQTLNDLVVRIESRIAKMDAISTDTSIPKALLVTAKTNVSLAATELTNLENLLAQNIPAVSTSTVKNTERKLVLKKINLQSEKTKTAIKTARASIIKVVESLKIGQLKEKNSTSTQQTESTSTNNQ